MNRREFCFAAGAPALLQTTADLAVGRPAPQGEEKKIRLAVLGGGFGTQFSWHEHPGCEVAAVTDLRPERRRNLRETYRCDNVYDSYEELLRGEKRLDAVAVFSGAPDHFRHAKMALERGLHVISAVPACFSLEEAEQLRDLKEKSGLRYMMAETSYYRPGCIFARDSFDKGRFGEIFYSELEYYHDRGELDRLENDKTSRFFEPDGSHSWRWGLAPLHYPTHSLGFLVGVTRERIRSVSALGWGGRHAWLQENRYQNPFWNESALMETERGHMTRCNVFWLVGDHGERAQWFGEHGSFYSAKGGLHGDAWRDRGGESGGVGEASAVELPDYLNDAMVPEGMRHASGHGGSHVFLAAEFINALVEDREPAVNVYEALAMTVPGIVGHQSALKAGERLRVPSFDRG